MEFLLDNIWKEKLKNRFLNYVQIYSTSQAGIEKIPSTQRQWDIANFIFEELKNIGLSNVTLDENAYIMAYLPSNIEKEVPTIGFISHFDTSPDFSGENVKPIIWENYTGEDLILNQESNFVLSANDFPELKNYKDQTIITTDGTTLLGADDKAGIAEIVTAMEYLLTHPEIKHGRIAIGFTPDEEVGKGADLFDVEKFGAQWAYTMDGSEIGELEYENFNAASAVLKIKGKSVHPGSAKNKMINAILLAQEFSILMPKNETPGTTEGYEGFYHLHTLEGNVSQATMHFIIRDHDENKFEFRKENMKKWVHLLEEKYGEGIFSLEIKDQYLNMKKHIVDKLYIIEIAEKAFKISGISPKIVPIRGGTDGAQLSYKGLPCPNIFAGGHNFHGPYEFVPLESMLKATEVIINIAQETVKAY